MTRDWAKQLPIDFEAVRVERSHPEATLEAAIAIDSAATRHWSDVLVKHVNTIARRVFDFSPVIEPARVVMVIAQDPLAIGAAATIVIERSVPWPTAHRPRG